MAATSSNRGASGCCLGCFSLLALSTGTLTLLLIAGDVGIHGVVAGVMLACLPVPLYAGLALFIDRYEPEPPGLLLGSFLWGATLAVFMSYLLNSFNHAAFQVATGSVAGGHLLTGVISAPLVEELSKGLCLFLLYFWKRREFNGIVDGVVYATMVALGFAMTENIQYYGAAFSKGGGEVAGLVFVLRGMMSPYAHPLFTSMTGIGLGWAAQTDRRWLRVVAPLGGLALAMTLHCIWNLTASLQAEAWLLSYVFLMAPTALGVLVVVLAALAREGGLLRKYLAGDLPASELRWVASLWGRPLYSLGKLLRKGPLGWLRSEQYLQVASELAFLRHNQGRGFGYADGEEARLATQLQELRSRLA